MGSRGEGVASGGGGEGSGGEGVGSGGEGVGCGGSGGGFSFETCSRITSSISWSSLISPLMLFKSVRILFRSIPSGRFPFCISRIVFP